MISPARASLERRLGPLDAAAIVISNVIGVGIFITPGFVATLVPNRTAILGVWVVGGSLAFAGALAYAELAARQPEAGGERLDLPEVGGRLRAEQPAGLGRVPDRVDPEPLGLGLLDVCLVRHHHDQVRHIVSLPWA